MIAHPLSSSEDAGPVECELVLLEMSATIPPTPVWTPPADLLEHSEMAAWLRELGLADYEALWQWSVQDRGPVWRRVWDRYGVQGGGHPSTALADPSMPGAVWFPHVALAYP